MKHFALAMTLSIVLGTPLLGQDSPAVAQAASDLAARVRSLEDRVATLEARLGDAPPVIRETPRAVVVPPGYHAHQTVDGRVVVHSDANYGDPAAHAGIAPPWVKTAVAGQTAYAGGVPAQQAFAAPAYYSAGGGCPGGVCPAGSGVFGFGQPVRSWIRGRR